MTTADDRRKAAATASTYHQGNIHGLDDAMTRRLVASTVLTESHGGDLAVTNKQGYVGRYQAGASWLVEAGYVNREKFDAAYKASGFKSEWDWAKSGGMTRFLQNDGNWNNGLSLDKYKASADLQDKAFKTNCDKLYNRAVKAGLLHEGDPPEKVAGFLKASHLGGYGAGRNVLQGKPVHSDSNGTSPYDYYNDIARNRDGLNQFMGRGGQTQSPSNDGQATQKPQAQAAGADGQLKRGEEGPEIAALQKRLNALGYGRADGTLLTENGKFGPNTEAAVVKFQKEHGLEGLGVVGPKTMAALEAAEKARSQGGQGQSQGGQTQKAPASHAIYNEAYQHFLAGGNQYEYGRGDKNLTNKEGNGKTDRSRNEQDLDGDGLKGVDCSSFVWRGLKNAGYDVGNSPFTTAQLFNGNQVTAYSKQHFDVTSGADARKPNGSLQPGDILLFKDKDGSGQHVGIFKGYDANGNIQFIGSQVSRGPSQETITPGGYWDGKEFQIVGALRAKPEFQVRAPDHGTPDAPAAKADAPSKPQQPAGADGQLKRGEEGPEVVALQKRLNALGYGRPDGTPLVENGTFGPNTEAAVIKFQKEHGLEGLGVVGPKTMAALAAAEKGQAQPTPDGQAKSGMALHAAHDQTIKYDAVKYGFGSKDVATGKVDCSGWVSQIQNATMEEINRNAGKTVFSGKDFFGDAKHPQTAADMIKDSVNTTGTLMRSPLDASKLKEGMIIGEDNGQKGWDKGRYNGIDHITMVVKDPKSGQLMISQSSSSGGGVSLMPLDKYLDYKQSHGVQLFATDPLAKARTLIEGQQQATTRTTDAPAAPTTRTTEAATAPTTRTTDAPAAPTTRTAENAGASTPRATDAASPPPTQAGGVVEKAGSVPMSDPRHADHRLYQQAVSNLEQLGPSGGFKSRDELEKAAAAVAADAKASGLNAIDHVSKTNAPNGQSYLVAVQGDPTSPAAKNAYLDYHQATTQTIDQSSRMAEAVRTQQSDGPAPKHEQSSRSMA